MTQPDVMTPDGRRDVAVNMLRQLIEKDRERERLLRYTFWDNDKQIETQKRISEVEFEFSALMEEILQLMGVDS